MKIIIGSDEFGHSLKEVLKRHLEAIKIDYEDLGCGLGESVLYPDIAERVALTVAQGDCERGILICGTGIGMAIAANDFYFIKQPKSIDNDLQIFK